MKNIKKIFLSPYAIIKKGSEYFKIKRIFKQILPTSTFYGKTIVFNTIRSIHEAFCTELILAALYGKSQGRSIIILDDGCFFHYDSLQYSNRISLDKLKISKNLILYLETIILQKFAKYAFGDYVDFIMVSAILRDQDVDINEIDKYNISQYKINIDDIAQSSTRRFFQTDILDFTNELHKQYYKLSVRNCKISLIIAGYIENKIKPTNFVTTHGIYSTWGPAFDYLKKVKSINCIVFGPNAYKKREISFFPEKHQITDKIADLGFFLNTDLDALAREKIISYFENRINRKEKDTSVYFKNIAPYSLNINRKKKIIVAFPNVIWDGDIQERNTIFAGVTDWLIKTIEYVRSNPEVHLIIRFHPSEATWYKNSVPLQSILENKIINISSMNNLTLIPSNYFIDTYDLVKNDMDIALIYDGMLALEVAFLGKPVLLCGRGRFTNNGFGVEVKNIDHYKGLLKNIDLIKSSWNIDKQRELAIRLCYYYLFHKSYNLPSLNNDENDYEASFWHVTESEIDISINKELKSLLLNMLRGINDN